MKIRPHEIFLLSSMHNNNYYCYDHDKFYTECRNTSTVVMAHDHYSVPLAMIRELGMIMYTQN